MKKDMFQSLLDVTRPAVTTKEAAFYLNRTEQTLRSWAMNSNKTAPIKPVLICGRLAWRVIDIKNALGISS